MTVELKDYQSVINSVSLAFEESTPLEESVWPRDLATIWTRKALVAQLGSATLQTVEDLACAVKIAVTLLEFDFHLIERCIERLGTSTCFEILDQTCSVIRTGGLNPSPQDADLVVPETGRRRTPGGVYMRFVKAHPSTSVEDKRYIFKGNTRRQQKIRRDMVRCDKVEASLSLIPQEAETKVDAVKKITVDLVMTEFSIIERLIFIKSEAYALDLAAKARMVDAAGGLLTANGERRRTPGGVFAQLVKDAKDLTVDNKRFIFAVAAGGVVAAPKTKPTAPGFLGDDDYSRAPALVPAEPSAQEDEGLQFYLLPAGDDRRRAVAEIACGLGVEKSRVHVQFMERAVYRLGLDLTLELYTQTQREEKETGGRIGGILSHLLKTDPRVTPADIDFIYDLQAPPAATETHHEPTASELAAVRRVVAEVDTIHKLTVGLKLQDLTFMERVVFKLGESAARALYNETLAVEAKGGMLTSTGERRKTPGGVFLHLLKEKASPDAVDFIVDRNRLTRAARSAASEVVRESQPGVTRIFPVTDPRAATVDTIVAELERMRITAVDTEIFARVLKATNEQFGRYAYEKTRKILFKSPRHSPGEVFAAVLKKKLPNQVLNEIFTPARSAQNFKNFGNTQDLFEATPEIAAAARDLALGVALLGFSAAGVSVVERVVERIGAEASLQLLERTRQIEEEGGQMTRDGSRRKTPAGVFLSVLKFEQKASPELMRYIFSEVNKNKDHKQEDAHYTPSLFTPLNPFGVVEGRGAAFAEQVKKVLETTLMQLEWIPVIDPRLPTVIRGAVFLGPAAAQLLERSIYLMGEDAVDRLLEETAKTSSPGDKIAAFRSRLEANQNLSPADKQFLFESRPQSKADREAEVEADGWTEVVTAKKRKHETSKRTGDVSRSYGWGDPSEVMRRLTIIKPTDARAPIVAKIVLGLKAFDVSVAERLVVRAGEALAMAIFRETLAVEAQGGVATGDGLRKKYPAGVFIRTVKDAKDLSADDKNFIFAQVAGKRGEIRRNIQKAKKARSAN